MATITMVPDLVRKWGQSAFGAALELAGGAQRLEDAGSVANALAGLESAGATRAFQAVWPQVVADIVTAVNDAGYNLTDSATAVVSADAQATQVLVDAMPDKAFVEQYTETLPTNGDSWATGAD